MVAITLQISTLRASSHPLSEQTRFLLETVFSLAFAPPSQLCFRTLAPLRIGFPDSVPGAWGQHLGPGGS